MVSIVATGAVGAGGGTTAGSDAGTWANSGTGLLVVDVLPISFVCKADGISEAADSVVTFAAGGSTAAGSVATDCVDCSVAITGTDSVEVVATVAGSVDAG